MWSEVVRDTPGLAALTPEWEALWRGCPERPATLHPAWAAAWWDAFGEGELLLIACRDEQGLCGVGPLYLVPPRGGALRARELRMVGEGLVSVGRPLLARAADGIAVRRTIVAALAAERSWDVLDLAVDDRAELEGLLADFEELGCDAEPAPASGLPELLIGGEPGDEPGLCRVAGADFAPELARLIERLRVRPGPTGEVAFLRFVEQVAPPLHAAGAAHLFVVAAGDPAAALVVLDGGRWIVLAATAEPGWSADRLTARLVASAARASASRLAFAHGALAPHAEPAAGVRLRVYGGSRAARFSRGYAHLVRRAGAVADAAVQGVRAPVERVGDRLVRWRGATPVAVQRVVARVATFSRLHLYRGELFVRGGAPREDLRLRLLSELEFAALPRRAELVERLRLDEPYAHEKWRRGDLVVLAEASGEPEQAVGIAWCARVAVRVPEIGRTVQPQAGECYIHDVYVPPEARGRAVAPAMLEFLSRELRARDVYRAWALIDRANTASTRAFEKAGYVAAADVIYARMGRASKLLLRPPDPEARAFLGRPFPAAAQTLEKGGDG